MTKGGIWKMIKINKLSKAFDGHVVLNDLDMHVPKGAVYGLVGPNGAGKSTLMRLVTGIYRQDKGSIKIDGVDPYENALVKERFAYIPDELFYHVQDNTEDLMKYYAGLYPKFDRALFEKLKEVFPSIDTKQPIRRLSKGMKKQVIFWLSICCRPDLMILDEPVDGLDPVMRRQIWGILLSDVAESGMTVLVSSHNLRELEDVCDHVGILHKGKIMLERSLSDLQSNVIKIQVAYANEVPDFRGILDVLHEKTSGRVTELIVRGEQEVIRRKLAATDPLFTDMLPLTLEEIFIYEMGGADYEIKDIFI